MMPIATPDAAQPSQVATLSDWREDPITRRRVRIAPARASRPNDYTAKDAKRRCPFCGGSESDTPLEVDRVEDSQGNWLTRVVPNQFPAVEGDAGEQEVVIESPRHVSRLVDLTPDEATAAVTAWTRRLTHWRHEGRFDYSLVFKNEGPDAGASLQHAHSQVLTLPRPPERAARLWDAVRAGEVSSHEHPIWADDVWKIVAPDSPRFAFETWLRPHDDAPAIAELASGQGAGRLASLLQRLVAAVTEAASQSAYNLILQTPPASMASELADPWWIEIVPRSSVMAGLELATGLWITPTPPEAAARVLAEKLNEPT